MREKTNHPTKPHKKTYRLAMVQWRLLMADGLDFVLLECTNQHDNFVSMDTHSISIPRATWKYGNTVGS